MRSCSVAGTPNYMAPEYFNENIKQTQEFICTPSVDIYGLGLCGLEMFQHEILKRPTHIFDSETLLKCSIYGMKPVIGSLDMKLIKHPYDLAYYNVLEQCTRYDPKKRCTALDVIQML